MTIKSKIHAGIIFMFVQLSVISLISIYNSSNLANMGKSLFTNNSRSIQYCENIIKAAEGIRRSSQSIEADKQIKIIEKNIIDEENNITEPGEKEVIASIKNTLSGIKNISRNQRAETLILSEKIIDDAHKISLINIKAIENKNTEINSYEVNFYILISSIATVFFIISSVFLFNFPNYACTPDLKFLKKDISDINKEINRKNR